MSSIFEPSIFTVPLSFEAHAIAQHYQKQQLLPLKAKQVYLNTLAVYAVDFYLRCLGFEVDANQNDSRNPMIVKMMDVADLWVKQLGRLECRPVLPDAKVCEIPPDAWSDRIGYVAVQMSQTLKEATLLGFTQTAMAKVPLSNLRSLSEFLAYLHQLQEVPLTAPPAKVVNLRRWLEGIFETGWQSTEAILGIDMNLVSIRSMTILKTDIKRAKLIDFGMRLNDQTVVLSLAVSSNIDGTISVLAQLYPSSGNTYLSPNVKLVMLSESGETLQEVYSRGHDNYIQIRPFKGMSGDGFSLQVGFNNVNVTEDFVL
ncbi:DUF1822 family protein [Komarekiella sp. 'clone 1']|uniref:DUF1822 family protein n=1 Tax=Komarekiella delphini-convector SJRDD-AB1 TaxID=2593771 RepID=A0AA40SUI5_9NOST|nr:DUF1822 family protein [Komarekiella delphini-convector]MBD6615501.1 DUF1822 family protein [Komarekiella delphini-convector SJRDD-AB1]